MKRKIFFAILAVLILGIAALVYASTNAFQNMPETTVVTSVAVVEHDVQFYVTAEEELYVGGQHTDCFGLYDEGFRWGYLYGLRHLLHPSLRETPVLFATGVRDVFPGDDGFLYTDEARNLHYFGKMGDYRDTVLAEHVVSADCGGYSIVYVTQDGSAWFLPHLPEGKKWGEPVLLLPDAVEIYENTFTNVRILCTDGLVHAFAYDQNRGMRDLVELPADEMDNCYHATLTLHDGGTLTWYRMEDQPNGVLNQTDVAENVELFSVDQFRGDEVLYLTGDGKLVLWTLDPHSNVESREALASFEPGEIVQMDRGIFVTLLLHRDGTVTELRMK